MKAGMRRIRTTESDEPGFRAENGNVCYLGLTPKQTPKHFR